MFLLQRRKKRHCSENKGDENEGGGNLHFFFFAAPLHLVDSITPGPALRRVGKGAPPAPMYRHQVCPGGVLTERSRSPLYENHHQERQKCDCDTVIHSSTAVRCSKLTADSSLRTPSFFILSLDTPPHHPSTIYYPFLMYSFHRPICPAVLLDSHILFLLPPKSLPRLNFTYLSITVPIPLFIAPPTPSPHPGHPPSSSIFNTPLVPRILSYRGAMVFVRLQHRYFVAMTALAQVGRLGG